MPFPSATEHYMHHRVLQEPGNNERIIQWIQELQFLQAPTTPLTEEGGGPPAGRAVPESLSPLWAPDSPSLPVDNVAERIAPTATTAVPYRSQQLAYRGVTSEVGRPPAPTMLTIPLPQAEETQGTPSVLNRANGSLSGQYDLADHRPIGSRLCSSQGGETHHIHHQPPSSGAVPTIVNRAEPTAGNHSVQRIQWQLNAALRYHNYVRAVVGPVLCNMPPYPGHRWGAQDQDSSCVGELNVHFPCSMAPATNPPLTRMRLSRPFGGKLAVVPGVGNQFVSVGDVQKTVVAWMRWEQPHVQDDGLQLTRRESVRDQNGTTISIEVWVWRGLKQSIGETDEWEINL